MPQKPLTFNPDEYAVQEFDPNEFNKPPEQKHKSFWESAKDLWHKANEPLTNLPVRVADYLSKNGVTSLPAGPMSIPTQFAGQLLSDMTSPFNLATLGLGGLEATAAKHGLSTVAKILNYGSRAASAPVAAEGVSNVINAPDLKGKASGLVQAGLGTLGMVHSPIVRIPEVPVNDIPVRPPFEPAEIPIKTKLTRPLPPLPVEENESIIDYLRRNGVDNIYTTPEEQAANRAFEAEKDFAPSVEIKKELPSTPAAEPKIEILEPEIPFNADHDIPKTDLRAWADHEAYRDAEIEAGRPDPGPIKEGTQRPPDIEVNKPQQIFDPNTLEFVDPNTGEIISSTEAPPQNPPKIPGRKRIILTEGPKQTTEQPVSPKLQAIFSPNPGPVNQPWSSVGQLPTNQGSLPINNLPLTPAGIPRQYGPKPPKQPPMGPRLPPRPPNNPPPPSPPPGPISNILNLNKAMLTAGDFSAPGRQGKAFIFNKAWWTSWDDMFKAWGSKQASDLVHDSIINHPSGYFKPGTSATGGRIKSLAEQVGLQLPEHEEMFTGGLGKKFGSWIDKSSRAHTAFLNKLRSDQFVSMMNDAKNAGFDPERNLSIAKAYAEFINNATGRGSLNVGKWKLEKNINVLNDVFFAPKNMSGQIRTWNGVLNPIKYANYDPILRKQALKSLFAIAGLGLGVGEMARLGGASVNNDPTNADFRKIRIGDTRIDLFGGYQQFPVAAMKLLAGQSTSSTSGKVNDLTSTKFGAQSRQSVAERFFTNRLSPLGSFIWAWMSNKEFDGKPFEVKRALYERVFPIAAKDITELAQEDPALAAATAIPTMTGLTGTQHYSGR